MMTTPMRSDLKLEVVVIPVSDVDRAKRFYESLGWRLDADFAFDNGFREAARDGALHMDSARR
jgi:catechol 2,3-dioxygenase-like lactoylglutathione lyase family enzyme